MKEYSNEEITVYWDPKRCIHSTNCVKGLPEVFDRSKRPWINLSGASSEEIMRAIDRCPSDALSYKKTALHKEQAAQIKVTEKGPLLVEGSSNLVDQDGRIIAAKGPFALCRCGGSKNKPFCDGTHRTIKFDEPEDLGQL